MSEECRETLNQAIEKLSEVSTLLETAPEAGRWGPIIDAAAAVGRAEKYLKQFVKTKSPAGVQ